MEYLGAFDMIVVGGGVNGAGIARDAVGRGLSVLLVEKGDLAQGTSSRSGKLVHGGLRYLEYYEFRLVREALIEREVLLNAAPHIIWPMRFVLPHSPEQRPAWLIRLGLFLYDHLGGRKKLPPTRALDLRRAPEGVPIRKEFQKAFEYSDCWVDDARLVVINALDVKKRGGEVRLRTSLTSARREADRWNVTLSDGATGSIVKASGRALVNAAGPWVENVLRSTGGNADNRVRLVKGSHIITRKFWRGEQAYFLQNRDNRVIFVNPYEGDLCLIGTTDIPFNGKAEDVEITSDEVDYLLDVINRYFVTQLKPSDVIEIFLRCEAAVRRQRGQPQRRYARLCLRHRRAERRRADAVRVRRQDHHLSQARRTRAREAQAAFPRDGRPLDRKGLPARGRPFRRRF